MNTYEIIGLVADGLAVLFLGMLITLWLDRLSIRHEQEVCGPWEKEEKRHAKQAEREARRAREEWARGVTVRDREQAQERERLRALRKAEKRKKSDVDF